MLVTYCIKRLNFTELCQATFVTDDDC